MSYVVVYYDSDNDELCYQYCESQDDAQDFAETTAIDYQCMVIRGEVKDRLL